MKNKLLALLCILVAWLVPNLVHAQAIITEIMYDVEGTDTGREWIEVKNAGPESIDLSLWKLFEANTNHKLTPAGESVLTTGGFAIIADDPSKFRADNPTYSGLLFDSAFSLNNTGETLILRDQNGADIDSVPYSSDIGAVGDGNSLQKTGAGTWIAAAPTIGSETIAVVSENPPTETEEVTKEEDDSKTGDSSLSSHQSQSSISSSYEEPELTITSGRSRLGYVGVPLEFEAKLRKAKNVSMGNSITSMWSMGDGNQVSGQFISYTYEFPGEYIVIVNSDNGGVHSVSKSKVKIVEPKVAIKNADEKSIEIANLDSSELNIGGFVITTKDKRFVIPADTIISGRSSIKMPLSATKFRSVEEYIDIETPRGRELSRIEIKSIGNLAAVQENKGELLVTLPNGLTLETLREKLMLAVETQEAIRRARQELLANQPAQSVQAPEVAVEPSTSTQPAAVIYSEMPKNDANLWQRIKAAIGR